MREKIQLHQFKELFGKGKNNYRNGEYQTSLEYYNQALNIVQRNNLHKEECKIIINQAGALYRLAKYKESEDYYYRALKIAKKNLLKKQECDIYNYFITLYEILNEYTKAKEYMDKGFEIAANLKNNLSLAKLLNSKGVYYHIFGNDEEALNCYEEAMERYQKSNKLRGIGSTSNLIAGHYYQVKEYDQSLNFYSKAKKISK